MHLQLHLVCCHRATILRHHCTNVHQWHQVGIPNARSYVRRTIPNQEDIRQSASEQLQEIPQSLQTVRYLTHHCWYHCRYHYASSGYWFSHLPYWYPHRIFRTILRPLGHQPERTVPNLWKMFRLRRNTLKDIYSIPHAILLDDPDGWRRHTKLHMVGCHCHVRPLEPPKSPILRTGGKGLIAVRRWKIEEIVMNHTRSINLLCSFTPLPTLGTNNLVRNYILSWVPQEAPYRFPSFTPSSRNLHSSIYCSTTATHLRLS